MVECKRRNCKIEKNGKKTLKNQFLEISKILKKNQIVFIQLVL